MKPYDIFMHEAIDKNGFGYLHIEPKHTAALTTLPFHHKDPFDRLLIAQAMVEGISIISDDPALGGTPFGVPSVCATSFGPSAKADMVTIYHRLQLLPAAPKREPAGEAINLAVLMAGHGHVLGPQAKTDVSGTIAQGPHRFASSST